MLIDPPMRLMDCRWRRIGGRPAIPRWNQSQMCIPILWFRVLLSNRHQAYEGHDENDYDELDRSSSVELKKVKAVLHRATWTVVERLSVLACWTLRKSLGICGPHILSGSL